MRFVFICAAVLLLAACADSSGVRSTGVLGSGTSSPRPKAIVVSDFTISSDLVVLDRGFTSRLERKVGAFPTYERKTRTIERVNDEIVATIVATLREAGLDAQPGSEEALSLAENAVLVTGRLRPTNPAAKKNEAGIGGGHGGVTAEMTLSSFGGFGKKQLIAFAVEPAGGKAAAGGSKAFNAAVAEALVAGKAAPEKLSADVEAGARKIGRAAGDKIVAYSKTQGWLDKPANGKADESKSDGADAAPEAKLVKLPAARPTKKPAA
jgi:hypothetical protein